MKYFALLVVALHVAASSMAQPGHEANQSLQFSFGNYWVPAIYKSRPFQPVLNLFALKYSHKVAEKSAVSLSYSRWYNINQLSGFHPASFVNGYYENWPMNVRGSLKGQVYARHNYQFLDLAFVHRLVGYGAHSVTGSLGPSYARGKNIEVISSHDQPNVWEPFLLSDELSANYWGGVGGLAYGYQMSKNFSVGAFANARVYNGLHAQPEVGLNVAYHFRALEPVSKTKQ